MAISGAAAAWLGTPLGLPWGVAPAAIFFAGALISVFLRPRDQAAILVLTPVVGLVNLLYLSDGSYWHYDIIGHELTLLRVDDLSLLFGLIFHLAGADLGRLRAPRPRPNPAPQRARLHRRRARRGIRRRPDHPVRLLGDLGAVLGLSHLGAAERALERGRAPLSHGPHRIGTAVADRCAPPRAADGRRGVRFPRPRYHRRVADLRRLRNQMRISAPAQLAHRRLPRGDADGHRVPQHLHHQGRDLRAGARLSRNRAADLHRRGDDRVPHLLCGDRERPPPRSRLQHDQPARVHGRGHRHRHGAGDERRAQSRLQRRDLQGTAVHDHGCGTAPDRAYQRLGPRRALQDDAVHRRAVHHRSGLDLGVSAVFGLRFEVDGDGGAGRRRLRCGVAGDAVRLRRRLPPRRHQDFLISPSSPTIPASAPRSRRGTCSSP